MITTQTNKQIKNKLYNKRACICIALIQANEKSLIKFAAVSGETLKTVKSLQKILHNIDIIDLCLVPCFWILLKKQLESIHFERSSSKP